MSLLRPAAGPRPVTNIELFFDLVYVFAVTQLSHQLLAHLTVAGALRTALLLALVWQAWVYTTWVTNWLDPDRFAVRLALVALMLASLVMSIGLPAAFGARGWAVGGAYAAMQIGRSAFAVAGLRGSPLRRNYQRILCWCVVSGSLAVAGAAVAGHARELLWLLAVGVDLLGGTALFLAGHSLFKATVWRVAPTSRLVAIVVLALLAPVAPHLPAVWLGGIVVLVIVAVAGTDRMVAEPVPE